MTYKKNFLVCVKVGGKILREKDGVVYLPFGGEYSLLLKNLESRKSSVKVSIDGQDVLGGRSLLLDSNSSTELERFVNSLDRGNRFKFIQKTKEIAEHRGDRVDDGIVRVEFAFEQVTKHVSIVEHYNYYDHYPYYHDWYYPYWYHPHYPKPCPSPTWTVKCNSGKGSSADLVGAVNSNINFISQSSLLSEEGITVKGSESHQNFHEGYIGILDPSEVIVIRLRGEVNELTVGDLFLGKRSLFTKGEIAEMRKSKVEKPITVKDKIKCTTCGNSILPTVNFCEKCGTATRVL